MSVEPPALPSWTGKYQVFISKSYPTGATLPGWEEYNVSVFTEVAPGVGDVTEEQYDQVFQQFVDDLAAAGFSVSITKPYAAHSDITPTPS